ncbi:glycine cleavage system protein GcvH [Candidatus Peregrinibacteria bacterium]|nr:glycine cleavage system protein GcvH [Candidatus Peregrinibacteria bacterium]
MRPAGLKYTETHEWVKIESKDIAVIGITDYAVSQLSDLVHVELPKVGEKVEQGSAFGEIESVKTVSELISPFTGKIAEINKDAVKDLDLISEEPFEDGWLVKIKYTDSDELDSLMTGEEYKEFIEASEAEEEGKKEGEEDVDEEDFV